MKKETGYINVPALGLYDFEFFVKIDWSVESGYVVEHRIVYTKKI